MPFRRAMLVLILAFAWCWSAWHVGLEDAGLMFDHEHHAASHHGEGKSSHDHSLPGTGDDHSPIWARDLLKDGRLSLLAQLFFAFVALCGVLRFIVSVRPAEQRGELHREPETGPIWQFVRRCAPDSAAPPALS